MSADKLKIIHCIRAPLGGAFRHLLDLIDEQIKMGHELGIVCASDDVLPATQAILDDLKPKLALGLIMVPMARALAPKDLISFIRLSRQIAPLSPHVLHGHGAKGGVWARSIGSYLRLRGVRTQRIYSPHGGSLHYDYSTTTGKLYITLERLLKPFTDALVFTSAFEKQAYQKKIGLAGSSPRSKIVHNGLRQSEFQVVKDNPTAADLLFIGELRHLKGVDLLINALEELHRSTTSKPTLAIVGDGPDRALFEKMVADKSLSTVVRFHGYVPFKQALPLGKLAVIPSRAEALPYIVLELLAVQKPLITTHVGGIPEIYADYEDCLVQPDDQQSLTNALSWALNHQDEQTERSIALHDHLKAHFTLPTMAEHITQLYQSSPGDNEKLADAAPRAQQPSLQSPANSLRRTAK